MKLRWIVSSLMPRKQRPRIQDGTVSVEFGHTMLTPDGSLNHSELLRSSSLAHGLVKQICRAGPAAVSVVLVDDKQVDVTKRASLAQGLTDYLAYSTPIDYFCFERDLAQYLDDMLTLLTPGARRRQRAAIDRRLSKGYTLACSADIAIWHLLCLGMVSDTRRIMQPLRSREPFRGCDVTVTILPDHLSDPEEVAVNRFLGHLKNGASLAERVQRVYFPSGVDGVVPDEHIEHITDTIVTEVLACQTS
jgi:hypothetical protein